MEALISGVVIVGVLVMTLFAGGCKNKVVPNGAVDPVVMEEDSVTETGDTKESTSEKNDSGAKDTETKDTETTETEENTTELEFDPAENIPSTIYGPPEMMDEK